MNTPTLSQLDDLNTRLHAVRSAFFALHADACQMGLLCLSVDCAAAKEHLSNAIARVEMEIQDIDRKVSLN